MRPSHKPPTPNPQPPPSRAPSATHKGNPAGFRLPLLLAALLLGCEDSTPPVPAPRLPTATPAGINAGPRPTEAGPIAGSPVLPATTGPATSAPTVAGPALATADTAALTPGPPPPSAQPGALNSTSGLIYLAAGRLQFYDIEHQQTRVLAEGNAGAAASAQVTAFVIAPSGDRLAYLLTAQRTQNGACHAESELWLLSLSNIDIRRQVAQGLLPDPCGPPGVAQAIAQSLTFTPDGRQLAYLAPRTPGGPIGLWRAAGDPAAPAPAQLLAAPAAGLLLSPRWAPDGQAVAFLEASDLGTNGSYDADVALVPVTPAGAQPVVLAMGHALPGGHTALPPLDLTWVDTTTLAFQAWDPQRGPDGAWLVDTRAGPAALPRLLSPDQAGLGAWSPPGPGGGRRYAYRVPGAGLFVAEPGNPAGGALLAAAHEVAGTGAIVPRWSTGGEAIAFSTTTGALLVADRAHPGPPAAVALPHPLIAAWSTDATAAPVLAAVTADGKALGIFDRAGAPIAGATLQGGKGSPERISWEPAGGPAAPARLALQYASGADAGTACVLLTFDPQHHTLALLPAGPPVDETGALQWATLGPLPEP